MLKHISRGCTALAIATLAAATVQAEAQTPAPLTKVTLALPLISVSGAYAFIAKDMGYWKDEGLDVDIPVIGGGQGTNAVLAGDVQFSHSTGNALLSSLAHGQHLIAIANIINQLYYELVVSKAVAQKAGLTVANSTLKQRAAALKGLNIAIDAPNTIQDAYLTNLAMIGGLDPVKDVVHVPMQPGAVNPAMEAGRIDGFVENPPYSTEAAGKGTGVIWESGAKHDIPVLDPFVNVTITTRSDYCPSHADVCTKFLAGIKRAVALEQNDPAKALEVITPEFKGADPQQLKDGFDLARSLLVPDLKMNEKTWENTQNFTQTVGLMQPKDKLAKFEGVAYTNEYLK